MTLGKAVRVSQSIGLHTENAQRSTSNDVERLVMPEVGRRLWYSLYVLDQLLSLQLGRPPAIHAEGFKVANPSKSSDHSISTDISELGGKALPDQQFPPGEYFLAMILFSGIIARVFSLLYGPNRTYDAAIALSTVEGLDQELIRWKSNLPRVLRFDLAHTFEKSMTLKRQVPITSPD